jgi:hypothetical protein
MPRVSGTVYGIEGLMINFSLLEIWTVKQNGKKAVFWDVAPCSSCMNRRFGGTYRIHLQGRKNLLARNQHEHVAAD